MNILYKYKAISLYYLYSRVWQKDHSTYNVGIGLLLCDLMLLLPIWETLFLECSEVQEDYHSTWYLLRFCHKKSQILISQFFSVDVLKSFQWRNIEFLAVQRSPNCDARQFTINICRFVVSAPSEKPHSFTLWVFNRFSKTISSSITQSPWFWICQVASYAAMSNSITVSAVWVTCASIIPISCICAEISNIRSIIFSSILLKHSESSTLMALTHHLGASVGCRGLLHSCPRGWKISGHCIDALYLGPEFLPIMFELLICFRMCKN